MYMSILSVLITFFFFFYDFNLNINKNLPCLILVLCSSLALCYFVLVLFSPFNTAITSLGEDRADICAFRTLFSICSCFILSVTSSSLCLRSVLNPRWFTLLTVLR